MTRRILRELRIDKVAAVDRPCQEHASADIMKRGESYEDFCKRKFTADERDAAAANGHAMNDGSYPINDVEDLHNAIHAIGRGSGSHAAIRAHIISRAKALGATSELPKEWDITKENYTMLKELAKVLGLPETATEADVTKALAENVAKSAASVEALTKAQADLAEAQTLAKMSDKHKAFAANLTGDAKDKFMAMDSDGRDAECNKSAPDIEKALADGAAFRTPEGVVIAKAKVGDELFSVLKSQNDKLVAQGADLAKAREDAAIADMAKRSTDIGFGADFAPTLRKAYSGDSAAQLEIEKRIKGLQEQVRQGGLFKSFGGDGENPSGAEGELLAKVEEVKKNNPNLKPAQAYSKAYTDPANADIVKRMKAEAAA